MKSRLTESDIKRIVRRVINEQVVDNELVVALDELYENITSMLNEIMDKYPDSPAIYKVESALTNFETFINNAKNLKLTPNQSTPAEGLYRSLTMDGKGGFNINITKLKFSEFFVSLTKIFNSDYKESYKNKALDMIEFYNQQLENAEIIYKM